MLKAKALHIYQPYFRAAYENGFSDGVNGY
jgi:hypothetical protein